MILITHKMFAFYTRPSSSQNKRETFSKWKIRRKHHPNNYSYCLRKSKVLAAKDACVRVYGRNTLQFTLTSSLYAQKLVYLFMSQGAKFNDDKITAGSVKLTRSSTNLSSFETFVRKHSQNTNFC